MITRPKRQFENFLSWRKKCIKEAMTKAPKEAQSGLRHETRLVEELQEIVDYYYENQAKEKFDKLVKEERKWNEGIDEVRDARLRGYQEDPCQECGKLTVVKNGNITKCNTCGTVVES